MNSTYKNIIFCVLFSFLLIFCSLKKQDEKPPEQIEKVDTLLMYPMDLGEKAKKELTPQQQGELEINEDDVMNPFPG